MQLEKLGERFSIFGTICVLLGVDDVVERRNRNADVAGRNISRAVPQIGIAHVDSVEVWDPGKQVDTSRIRAPRRGSRTSKEVRMEQFLGQFRGRFRE